MKEITKENLRQFFEERPHLTPYGVSSESTMNNHHIYQVLNDDKRKLTKRAIEAIKPILIKYGWKEMK